MGWLDQIDQTILNLLLSIFNDLFFIIIFVIIFETGSYFVAVAGLELTL